MNQSSQQQRVLLATFLFFSLFTVYTLVLNTLYPPLPETADGGLAVVADGGAPAAAAALSPGDAGLSGALLEAAALDGGLPAAPERPALRELDFERDSMSLSFSNRGAALTRAVLKGKREHQPLDLSLVDGFRRALGATLPPPPPMDLAQPFPDGPGQFGVRVGQDIGPSTVWAVAEEVPGKVVFETAQGPWRARKTFTWEDQGYELAMSLELSNTTAQAVSAQVDVATARHIEPGSEQAPSLFGGIGNQASVVCRHADTVLRLAPGQSGNGCGGAPTTRAEGPVAYVGIDLQYFLTAVWPVEGAVQGGCALEADERHRQAGLRYPLELAPGQTLTRHFRLYAGPKDLDLLMSVRSAEFNPQLDGTVDFGIWAFLCKGLLFFLRLFHGFTGNWGVAIILLTFTVKVALIWPTHTAMVSAERMKKLAPKLEEIRKKYAGDQEKQNVETMRVYQEANVNPLGGCLPLLVQIPIWGALFTTLRTSYELYGEPFLGPWLDLTTRDPTYLLPLVLGATMIITQRLQPQMGDASQAFMLTWVMPVLFTGMMMNYPAGLALYIVTNNLLSIAQQYLLRKYLEATGAI